MKTQKIRRIRIRYSCHHAIHVSEEEYQPEEFGKLYNSMNCRGSYYYLKSGLCEMCTDFKGNKIRRGIVSIDKIDSTEIIS